MVSSRLQDSPVAVTLETTTTIVATRLVESMLVTLMNIKIHPNPEKGETAADCLSREPNSDFEADRTNEEKVSCEKLAAAAVDDHAAT